MKINGKRVMVCDCQGTMRLDGHGFAEVHGEDAPTIHTQLCRAQRDAFRKAVESGEPLLIACTQEAPLFDEVAAESAVGGTRAYVDIRERAGWSEQGARATPKIAALLAEAALELQPTPVVTLKSAGATLILGRDAAALAAAGQLAKHLNVSVVLDGSEDVPPPRVDSFPVYRGRLAAISGHLGAFRVDLDDLAAAAPSSRGKLVFEAPHRREGHNYDLILDLTGGPALFRKRDGYYRAAPGSEVQIQRVLLEIAEMVGEFEKPRYVRVNASICAHARNSKIGCTNCLDACPSSAIRPDGNAVSIDPLACSGHGACASACPTGAIVYDLPGGNGLFERLRVLLTTYRKAGGNRPVLMIHDAVFGTELIDAMARHGRGLPANVVPFAVNEITQIGFDALIAAHAWGAMQVRVVAGPAHRGQTAALERALELADHIAAGLGYGAGRFVLDQVDDPDTLEAALYDCALSDAGAAADFHGSGGKRPLQALALRHLHMAAPAPVETLALPDGAPFGDVILDTAKCTLCLSCVGACPTRALGDNSELPQLTFAETLCVQCGLCKSTCPEDAIVLQPRLNFTVAPGERRVLKEEQPFNCIRCGKAFGTKSGLDRMLEKLTGHPMFSEPGRLDLLKMCSDCRAIEQMDMPNPMASRPRPRPRTTDDYLAERDAEEPIKH